MSYLEAALKTTGYSVETWKQKWEMENKEIQRLLKEKQEKQEKQKDKKDKKDNFQKKKYKSNKYFKGNYNKKSKKSNTEYDKAINYARKLFVTECCISDKKELDKMISDSQYILNWSKKIWCNFDDDEIDMSGFSDSCKFKFTRSRFFTSSDFKNDVIQYYNKYCQDFWIQFIKPKSKNSGLMIFSKRR